MIRLNEAPVANNKAVFKVIVTDDGTLKIVADKAKSASSAVDKLSRSTDKASRYNDKFNRANKGVAGATSNSTKAFSKMKNGLDGNTGLVQSYAILASNVFAATAAFNALRRVSQVEQLGEGLQFVGNVIGRDLKGAAATIREVTGAAVSLSDAMRTTAVGISAGFSTDELEGLATVAKGASIALGRDMGDALDRLTRGVAKLEPEILDELGIIVRLDTAVQNYAGRLGLQATSLTENERRQAFLNATLTQGLQKYEDIAAAVEVNPYDKLLASLSSIATSIANWISNITGLNTAISFLGDNLAAMAGVATTALIPVTRRLAPGIFATASASAELASEVNNQNIKMLDSIVVNKKMKDSIKLAMNNIKDGTGTVTDFKDAQMLMQSSMGGTKGAITKWERANVSLAAKIKNTTSRSKEAIANKELWNKTLKENTEKIESSNARLVVYAQNIDKIKQAQISQLAANVQTNRAATIEAAAKGRLIVAYKSLMATKQAYHLQLTQGIVKTSILTKATNSLKTSMYTLALGVKAAGAAFLAFLPWIGLIVTAGSILYKMIKDKWFPEDLIQKRVDAAADSFDNFINITKQFADTERKGIGETLVAGYIAWSGILTEIEGKFADIRTTSRQVFAEQRAEIVNEIARLEEEAERIGPEFWSRLWERGLNHYYHGRQAPVDSNLPPDPKKVADNQEAQEAARARAQLLDTQEGLREVIGLTAVAEDALRKLKINEELSDNGFLNIIEQEEIKNLEQFTTKLKALQEIGNKGGIVSKEDIDKVLLEFERLKRFPDTVKSSFQGASAAGTKFLTDITKATSRTRDPLDNVEDAVLGIVNSFRDLEKTAGDRTETLSVLIAELEKEYKELGEKTSFDNDKEGWEKFLNFIRSSKEEIALTTQKLKEQQAVAKTIEENTKGIIGAETLRQTSKREAVRTEIKLLEGIIDRDKRVLNLTEDEAKQTANLIPYYARIAALKEQNIGDTEIALIQQRENLKLTRMALELSKENVALDIARLKNQMAINNLRRGLGTDLTAKDNFELAVKQAEAEVTAAESKLAILDYEFKIRRDLLAIQLEGHAMQDEILGFLDGQLSLEKARAVVARRTAEEALNAVKFGSSTSVADQFGINFGQSMIKNAEFALSQIQQRASGIQQDTATKQVLDTRIASSTDPAEIEALTQASDAMAARIAQNNSIIKQSFIELTASAVTPFIEEMKKLGADGELAAALAEGALLLSSSFLTIGESLKKIGEAGDDTKLKMQAAADAFAALGSIIGAISNIQQAQSRQAVEGVDREIEAEKKRDGKSSQSLQKIQSLEKKKEGMERKAFETKKKMLMAQTVMNTAAAVMATLAQGGGFFAIPLAVVIAAMGAMQLGVISGMTYQGGAGASASSGPSSVTVGERSNTVDLAKSRSPSGELGYFRGDSGTSSSGANNFVPGGFTGRATGGNTAFMVGEQGPELFIPESPGRVLPSDDSARIATGRPVSVNFNISAIDGRSVEQMLRDNTGTIISTIRDAANSRGNLFMEDLNVAEDDVR